MRREEVLERLAPWRAAHFRPAWKPVVREVDGLAEASKFSGTPWLDEGEAWPRCTGCQGPLQHFLQLNLSTLPAELGGRFGDGLLKLFYCDGDCDAAMDAWEPFSAGQLVRVIRPDGRSRHRVELPEGHLPPRAIVGWEWTDDAPSTAEHGDLGLSYEYDFPRRKVRVTWREAGIVLDDVDQDIAEEVSTAQPGDKLAGWPAWVQGVGYPACPQCGQRMELVFQLDSEDNLPFMFGDCGCGHITQCPEHKGVVAFGWACC